MKFKKGDRVKIIHYGVDYYGKITVIKKVSAGLAWPYQTEFSGNGREGIWWKETELELIPTRELI